MSEPKLSIESKEAVDRRNTKVDAFLKGPVEERVRKLLTEDPAQFDDFRNHVQMQMPGGDNATAAETFTLIVDRPAVKGEAESYKNAKHAAQVLADMYIVRFQELQLELSEPAVRVLEGVIADYEKYVKEKAGEYEDFVKANPGDIGMLEQLMKGSDDRNDQNLLSKVRENDASLSMDHARDKAIYEVLVKVLPAKALEPNGVELLSAVEVKTAIADTPAEFLQNDASSVEIQKQLAKLTAQKAKLETQFTPQSREMRNVTAEIERSMRQVLEQIVGRTRSLRATLEAREHQLAMNRELLKKTEQEQNEIHRKLVSYSRLKNDYQVAESHLAELRREHRDAISNTLQAREAVTIRKLSEASTPNRDHPVSPRIWFLPRIAFAATVLLGLLIAFFLDRFDHTFRSARDAERYIGLPVLGSIKKQRDGLVAA
ncbi:MAG: hypothetical protein IPK83_11775 [Planctomycetes bacterium]|nr:hypothetical protein [Planctomycetota bacterium]